MSFTFQGYQLTPGMHDERFTQEATLLWGREKQAEYVGAVLDKDTVDAGNSPTTQLRTGLALGIITATGQWTHWNPRATDGSNYLAGFLLDEIDLSYIGGTTKERLHAVIVKGNIKADQIVIGPGSGDRGLSGEDYEFLLREQAEGKFFFDDDLGKYSAVKSRTMLASDTALTVTTAMNKTLFVTDVDTASITFTLPAPVEGLEFYFAHPSTTAGVQCILDGPATGEFWVAGAAANTVVLAGDNATGLRKVRAVCTDNSAGTVKYVVDGPAA